MKIETKITFKEYKNLLLGLTYRRPIMKIILGVALLMALWIAGYYFHFLPLPEPRIYQYITLMLILVVQPLVIFMTIRRNYHSSNHLKEQLKIEMTQSEIKITGESFYTEIAWVKLFKIDEQKNWFLIYQNNLSAIIIPKKDFHLREEEEFKQILRKVQNIPIHLNEGHKD